MKIIIIIVGILSCAEEIFFSKSEDVSISKSVTLEDFRLSKSITPSLYTIHLRIPNVYGDRYTGSEVIVFQTSKTINEIKIHSSPDYININQILINPAQHCTWSYSDPINEILTINCNRTIEPNQEHSIMIAFESIFSSHDQLGLYKVQQEKSDIVLLTDFSPTFARRVFPCFDEPNFKAVFNIFVVHPDTYHVLGNTPIESQVVSGSSIESQFSTTPLISTYSIGFVISKLVPIIDNISDVDFVYNIFTKSEHKEFGKTGLSYGTSLVNAMGEWTGIKYHDMGNLQLFSTTVENLKHGMINNWGLLINREENVLDEGIYTSAKQKERIFKQLANQIAHQWFGGYISLNWWSDLWLNEGFATYFEYHITDEVSTEYELENQFVVNVFQNALHEDSILNMEELSSNQEELSTSSNILHKFSKLMADKGASIIRMMELILGKEKFRENMMSYIEQVKFNTTNPTLLLDSLDFGNLMDPYLYRPGYPLITVRLEDEQSVYISQEPFFLIKDDNLHYTYWNVPIAYTTSIEKDFNTKNIIWLKYDENLKLPLQSNSWIILNNQQSGYYRTNYDDELWRRIIEALKGSDRLQINVINRAQLIDDIFAVARVDKVSYNQAFQVLSYIEHETDYYPWVTALKVIQSLINQISDKETSDLLKKNTLQWINTAFPNLNEVTSDKHLEIMKQNLILSWKCYLGDTNCLNNAKNKYEEYKSSKTVKNYNERDIILCYGIKTSSKAEDEFAYLMQIYQDSKSRVEKEVLLSALGCLSDSQILKSYLTNLLLDNSVIPKHDAIKVFEAVLLNNDIGVAVALSFLTEYSSRIIDTYTGIFLFSDFIITISDKISTWNQLDELQTLLEKYEELQNDSTIRALKIIEYNLQWADNYTDTIKFIMEHPPSTGSSEYIHSGHTYLISFVFLIIKNLL